MRSMILLADIEARLAELEGAVNAFEATVVEVEREMDEVERRDIHVLDKSALYGHPDGLNEQDLQQLEDAIETTEYLAEQVRIADIAFKEAIDAVQSRLSPDPAALLTPPTTTPTRGVTTFQDAPLLVPEPPGGPVGAPLDHGEEGGGEGEAQNVVASLVDVVGVGAVVSGVGVMGHGTLPEGSIILNGQYRLLQLLHQRPRVNLYLAQRLYPQPGTEPQSSVPSESLVAIRELVLTGLPTNVRAQIEKAAFEEFAAPGVLGSPHLPRAGDRLRSEGERHYLVMQLRGARGRRPAVAVTLAELLLGRRQWPLWLDVETAFGWGLQLCRTVARLHRLGIVLGDLHPTMILVDREEAAEWAPVPLISWPPSPQPRPMAPTRDATTFHHAPLPIIGSPLVALDQIFPPAHPPVDDAFAAPELLDGVCDERSDVYSLGAILYLLLTRYAPIPTAHRRGQTQDQTTKLKFAPAELNEMHNSSRNDGVPEGPAKSRELIPPHLLNNRLPSILEEIVLRALALNPGERYQSVAALVGALEAVDLKQILVEVATSMSANGSRKVSRIGKVVEWLRRELNS
jgi:hypothetical protein